MRKRRESRTAHIAVDKHLCQACWQCYEACPKQVFGKINVFFGLHKHIVIENPEACIGCKKCVKACQYEAIVEVSA